VNDVDKNMRLIRGLFFEENPDLVLQSETRRGLPGERRTSRSPRGGCLAMRASSFTPCRSLMYRGLAWAGRRRVQDNQGSKAFSTRNALHDHRDASGQMNDLERPSTLLPSVAGRTMSIYGDRIRDEQLAHALTDADGMALLHLRKDWRPRRVSPISSPTPPRPERQGEFTSDEFGVHEGVQEALSGSGPTSTTSATARHSR
jgi:hypothetical protein